jgi:hypothetical protein
MDNAKQQCIKVNNYTDEMPYIINLSVGGYFIRDYHYSLNIVEKSA